MPSAELNDSWGNDGEIQGMKFVDQTRSIKLCSVCGSNQSRYTCPRCQAPYCSVLCYGKHAPSPSSSIETGSEGEVSPCTEAFYKNRVSSILELEVNERKNQTKEFLSRHYHDELRGQQEADDFLQSEDLDQALTTQLNNLLIALEKAEKGSLSQEELFLMMPLPLKERFQQDLQDGKLSQQVLQRWHPWWRRELGPIQTEVQDLGGSPSSLPKIPLDERLLKIPSFGSLHKSASKPPDLLFNLIDMLYSYVWTLRLFHGTHNMKENELEIEVCTTLIQYSSVLREDSRYTSLEQVMSNCTASSTKYYPSGCNASWTVLVMDCSLLLTSHRLVGRALLEIADLLKAAIRELKKSQEQTLPIIPSTGDMNTEGAPSLPASTSRKEVLARFRKVRKKVEFFLSWSQAYKKEFGSLLEKDVQDWMEKWQLSEENDGGTKKEVLHDLQFPPDSAGETPSIHRPTAPLMVERCTRRKEQSKQSPN